MADIGYVTLPVIASFSGIDAQVNKVFGPLGKKSGKDFGRGMADGLKVAEDSYAKLRNKAEDSLGKIRIAEAALTKARSSGNEARIVAAEERLATSRRNSSISLRDAQRAHDALKSSQDGLKDSSSGLGGALDGLGGKLGTVGAIAGGAALAGVALLGAGVVLAGTQLYELGRQFDDTFDNIRIKTGATGPALKQLEEATKSLSTKVPLSIGQIGNVVAETSRALHITGPELDNTARSIANLGRLTGEPVNIRELGKAFRGFGVDAKDQVPALDSLLRASQATGVPINELLATVVKGGAGLRQFGFDFGESAALVTQFEAAGLNADKAMTGLTKGLAGLAKDGKTGKEALRGTVDEIKNLITTGQDAEALNMTNKLFGAKGGVQFFEAIKNGALDLDALAASMSNTGDTIDKAARATDDWAERWQTFKNQLAVGLEPIATGVFNVVNTELTGLADWVSGHQDEVIRFFGRVGDAAITGAQGVLTFASSSLRALGDLIKGLGDSFGPVFASFSKIGNVLQYVPGFQTLGSAMKTIGDAGSSINDAFAKAPGLLNKGADAIDGWAAKLPGVKTAWDAIVERTADATTFTQALGNATASVPDGKEIKLSANTPEVVEGLKKLGIEVVNLPDGSIGVTANTDEGRRIIQAFRDQQIGAPLNLPVGANTNQARLDVDAFAQAVAGRNPIQIPIAATPGAPGAPTPSNPFAGPFPHASGGPIFGPGTGTSDSVPIMASRGEHMWTASEVNSVGGQGSMYRLRGLARMGALKGFKEGGEITSDWYSSVVGSPYAMGGFGSSFDCSGAVSGGVNVAMGRAWNQGPPGGSPRMATGSEAEWLKSQGFVMGVGPPGSIRVGWVNGGPGGGHTAMTLADGTNFESSSGKGVALGGNARGASDPMFTQHAYLPAGPQMPGSKGSPASQAPASSGGGSSSRSGGGGGGGTNLSDMVGGAVKIGIDGLLETIGADGSFLPENLGIPKTLMAALGLKFNTPAGSFSLSGGFQPAKNGTPGEGGGSTSFSPFGMQTTMPQVPGSPASGVGTGPAPGPVDQSTNININNPQGDPAEIEKRTRTALKTTPRVDTHMPAGF